VAQTDQTKTGQSGPLARPTRQLTSPAVAPRIVNTSPEVVSARRLGATALTVPEQEPLPNIPPPERRPVTDPRSQLDGRAFLRMKRLASEPRLKVFAGITSRTNPPDTVGDVGLNHYVQMVNATLYQVFDKRTGQSLAGPSVFGDLWPQADPCHGNAGDPIVMYDHLAGRWLLSQFAKPNHMCIAISNSEDPSQPNWHVYTFDTVAFPDYQKFGVWPDGYYMSTYEKDANVLGIYVFDRANMLAGKPATFMKTTIPALGARGVRNTRILPTHLDGLAPPERMPNFFVRTVDDQQDPANSVDRIEVWSAAANFATSTFTFSLVNTLSPLPFQVMLCDRNAGQAGSNRVRDCIPQVGSGSTVDALSNRPMMHLRYRNFGTHQTLTFNQTIDVSGSMPMSVAKEVAGIRWYELRDTGQGTNWSIFQQGTFAPQPPTATSEQQLLHRWLGSLAMDKFGNSALVYSVTNDDAQNKVFPGIRFAGRSSDDPPGLMTTESPIVEGTSVQGAGLAVRWGDYSSLSVDPADDCTFWFTTHVAGSSPSSGRPTHVASFRLDEKCAAAQ
jgi:hypothetical protein